MLAIRHFSLASALGLLGAASAMAVGLGPLAKSGITDSPGKAFYLTLINPYPQSERFTAEAHALIAEDPAPRVAIFPANSVVGAGGRRQLLVVVRNLAPGETYAFRVCAQRLPRPEETVHARVCSKLSVRRVARRSQPPGDGAERLPPRPA